MVNDYTYLSLFCQAPNKTFSLQEFEEHHKRPHQTIKRHLERFVEQRILAIDKRKRFRFYQLNKDNPLAMDALSICEKQRLQERITEDYLLKELYEDLSKHFDKCSFLIFGSATNSEQYNDIDIICIGKDNKIDETIQRFENTFNKEIQLLKTDFQTISETLHKELIKKHLILNNHDHFVRKLFKKT